MSVLEEAALVTLVLDSMLRSPFLAVKNSVSTL